MAQGNTHGNTFLHYGKLSAMEAFDRLPKALRQALAHSEHNWSANQCLIELRKPKAKRRAEFASTEKAVAFISAQDARKHVRDAEAGLVCL